ncbi:MAG: GNAT family N-acetyltransferase [bacterium]|nr:GNAT family N-acetyltransferase [Candidatus Kapabacteria bacterium]
MSHADRLAASTALCSTRELIVFGSDARYTLVPTLLFDETESTHEEIVRICNEPLIYSMLFASAFEGRRYERDDALRFLDWGDAGWEEATHFVYVITDATGAIAGAIDIKSPTFSSAEIGYWLSAEHSGVMTAAVVAITSLAHDAGFVELHALVRPENERSARVLTRAGFERAGNVDREGRVYDRYARPTRSQ